MLNELSNDPIQAAISRLEKQHEEDKQGNNILNKTRNIFNPPLLSCSRKTTPRIRKTVPTTEKYNVTINTISTLFLRSISIW